MGSQVLFMQISRVAKGGISPLLRRRGMQGREGPMLENRIGFLVMVEGEGKGMIRYWRGRGSGSGIGIGDERGGDDT